MTTVTEISSEILQPETMSGRAAGSCTRRKVCQREAPMERVT